MTQITIGGEVLEVTDEMLQTIRDGQPRKVWPQDGDEVCALGTDGKTISLQFDSEHHQYLLANGCLHPTRELAEKQSRRNQARAKVHQYMREKGFGEKVDWEDFEQVKYGVTGVSLRSKTLIQGTVCARYYDGFWFDNDEQRAQALADMEAEMVASWLG